MIFGLFLKLYVHCFLFSSVRMSHSCSSNMSSEPHSDEDNASKIDKGTGCYPQFGIRSHLNQFYDYESDREQLVAPRKIEKRCSPIVWKIIIWFGVSFLIVGAVLILVGHTAPRRPNLKSISNNGRFAVVDQDAINRNIVLDALPNIGFVLFGVASALILIGIGLPKLCHEYCFEDRPIPNEDEIQYTSLPTDDARIPVQPVPKTEKIHTVQPTYKPEDSYQQIK